MENEEVADIEMEWRGRQGGKMNEEKKKMRKKKKKKRKRKRKGKKKDVLNRQIKGVVYVEKEQR